MADLIDRQAAIDAMGKAKWAKERLMELPSVQPDHTADISKKVADEDCISRQAAIYAAREELESGTYFDIPSKIEALPAVQPDHSADIGKKVEGDCISRQAAVKFFNDWISCLDENCHHQSVADMIIIKNDFKNLPSIQSEPHWIPCSERMPVEGQKCLVYDKAIGFRVDVYIGHGNPFNWELFVRDYEAWMPLPKPYRGGEE